MNPSHGLFIPFFRSGCGLYPVSYRLSQVYHKVRSESEI